MLPADMSPLWISLKTTLAATGLAFILGLLAARLVASYEGPGKGLIDGLLILPLVLPPTVVGFLLLVLCGRYGPVGKLLYSFEYTIIFSWEATVLAAAVVSFPLMYKAARASLEQVDPELEYVARSLGLPEWKIFLKIIVPLAWPGIAAGTALAFARALGEFGATLMIAGNIPGRTQTIPLAIYFNAEGGKMDYAVFWTVLVIAISIAVLMLINYWNRRQPRHAYRSGGNSLWS